MDKNKTFEKLETLANALGGEEQVLAELLMAMSADELNANFDYIARMHDIEL